MSNSQRSFAKLIDLDFRRKGMVLGTAIALEMACQVIKEATGQNPYDVIAALAIAEVRKMSLDAVDQEILKIDNALTSTNSPPFHRWTMN